MLLRAQHFDLVSSGPYDQIIYGYIIPHQRLVQILSFADCKVPSRKHCSTTSVTAVKAGGMLH